MMNYKKLTPDEIDNLTEEEFDAYLDWQESIKNRNSRKTLMPLFILEILKEHSNAYKHLTQREIITYLDEYPYGVSVERKAVGRTIQLLADENMGIHTDKRTGSWYAD